MIKSSVWLLCGLPLILSAEIMFEDVTASVGLDRPLKSIMGHGAAWGDVDGDGDPDLYVGGFADRPNEAYGELGQPPLNALLVNEGDRFRLAEMPHLPSRTSGAVFADLDNDGRLDLYVANNAKSKVKASLPEIQQQAQGQRSILYQNRWPYLERVKNSGATPDALRTARNLGVFDVDRDGLLDLFVVEDRFTKNSRSVLLKNEGSMRFTDVLGKYGLPEDIFGLGLAVGDVNNDRRPDFFVGHSNRMFVSNPQGGWTEPESLKQTFAWKPLHNEDWPCGAAFGDLNNDGWPDLVLGIHGVPARNQIFLHQGLGEHGEPVFKPLSLAQWPQKCPHVEIQDFDNDGWPDLFFSAAKLTDGEIMPLIYRNLGAERGIPRFEQLPMKPQGEEVYFPAGPSADYDGDGRIDLFLVNWFEGNHCRLLRNTSEAGNWLRVKVVGQTMNRMGIGAVVEIQNASGKRLGRQEITTGYGYASGQVAEAHFGLGTRDEVSVKVMFPNGTDRVIEEVKANQRLEVKE